MKKLLLLSTIMLLPWSKSANAVTVKVDDQPETATTTTTATTYTPQRQAPHLDENTKTLLKLMYEEKQLRKISIDENGIIISEINNNIINNLKEQIIFKTSKLIVEEIENRKGIENCRISRDNYTQISIYQPINKIPFITKKIFLWKSDPNFNLIYDYMKDFQEERMRKLRQIDFSSVKESKRSNLPKKPKDILKFQQVIQIIPPQPIRLPEILQKNTGQTTIGKGGVKVGELGCQTDACSPSVGKGILSVGVLERPVISTPFKLKKKQEDTKEIKILPLISQTIDSKIKELEEKAAKQKKDKEIYDQTQEYINKNFNDFWSKVGNPFLRLKIFSRPFKDLRQKSVFLKKLEEITLETEKLKNEKRGKNWEKRYKNLEIIIEISKKAFNLLEDVNHDKSLLKVFSSEIRNLANQQDDYVREEKEDLKKEFLASLNIN